MAWTAPATFVTGQIILASDMNTYVRDNSRYLKGMDSVVQIQDGIQMTGTGTASYFKPPVLTTTQRNAIASPANGMMIYNTTDGKLQKYEATAWRTDLAYGGTLTYLLLPSMAQGDIFYADTATSITRLGAGTSGQYLKTQGAAANPIWTDPVLNVALYVNGTTITSTGAQVVKSYTMPANTISGTGAVRITAFGINPAGFTTDLRAGTVTIARSAAGVGTMDFSVIIQSLNATSQQSQAQEQWGTSIILRSTSLALNVTGTIIFDSYAGSAGYVDKMFMVEKLQN